jgi:phosphate transport system substrate-binding protein
MRTRLTVVSLAAAILSGPAPAIEPESAPPRIVDSSYPAYEWVPDLGGRVTIFAPAASLDAVRRCTEPFREIYPSATIEVAPAPAMRTPADFPANADLLVAVRRLTDEERRALEARDGRPPVEISIGATALAVFVFRENPVTGLTLQQLDAIFSRTQRRGAAAITAWGGAGLAAGWKDQPVVAFGLGPESSAATLFRDLVLSGGEFLPAIRWQFGPSSVVQGVGAETGGVGFAPPSYLTRRTRAVPIAASEARFVEPSQDRCLDGTYPLARPLTVVAPRRSGSTLPAAVRELLVFLCAREGQESLEQNDMVPLTAALAKRQMDLARQ